MTYSRFAEFPEYEFRVKAYSDLFHLALKEIELAGETPNPETITDYQEALAIERHIVPPHFTGWIECERCGLMPASAKLGDKVKACLFCTHFDAEKLIPNAECIPQIIAISNRAEYFASKIREREAQEDLFLYRLKEQRRRAQANGRAKTASELLKMFPECAEFIYRVKSTNGFHNLN